MNSEKKPHQQQTTCPSASGQVVFVCLSRNQCKFTRFVCRLSAGNEEHCGEQYADDPGAEADIFDLAGEELDEDVGDKAERNTIGDIVYRCGSRCRTAR